VKDTGWIETKDTGAKFAQVKAKPVTGLEQKEIGGSNGYGNPFSKR
jgi:hypothetical protein